ncbi:MAG: hypothetical protein GTO17_04560 [Candidatus Aminicenantes bacterium]|nr:hypothetical protein [Candidatus Aminicenantes bacterium]
MTKKAFIMPVILIMLVFTLSAALVEKKDTKTKILEACEVFFNPNASLTQDNMVDSLSRLLDITASITTAYEYKDEIKYRIDVAKNLLKEDSLFNEKARQYLSFAYRMMTNGQKYQKPEELDVFVTPAEAQEKAMKYAKNLVEKALSDLEEDNPGETAKLLLELVLMVVTPIEG